MNKNDDLFLKLIKTAAEEIKSDDDKLIGDINKSIFMLNEKAHLLKKEYENVAKNYYKTKNNQSDFNDDYIKYEIYVNSFKTMTDTLDDFLKKWVSIIKSNSENQNVREEILGILFAHMEKVKEKLTSKSINTSKCEGALDALLFVYNLIIY